MNLHQEHHFEREICEHLAAHGWLYAQGDAARFDRASGCFCQNPQMIPPNIAIGDALDDLKELDQLRPWLSRLARLCERGNVRCCTRQRHHERCLAGL